MGFSGSEARSHGAVDQPDSDRCPSYHHTAVEVESYQGDINARICLQKQHNLESYGTLRPQQRRSSYVVIMQNKDGEYVWHSPRCHSID